MARLGNRGNAVVQLIMLGKSYGTANVVPTDEVRVDNNNIL